MNNNLWILWYENNEYSIEYGYLLDNEKVIGLEYKDLPFRIPVYSLYQNLAFPFPNETELSDDNEKYLLEKIVDPLYFTSEVLKQVFYKDNNYSLKDHIIEEVQNLFTKKKQETIDENEINYLIVECWKDIWRKCTQKWLQIYSPIGFIQYSIDTIGILTLSSNTLIRPCESIETLYLFPKEYNSYFLQFLGTRFDETAIQDMILISSQMKKLSSFIHRELNEYEMSIFYNEDPFIELLLPIRKFLFGLENDEILSQNHRMFLYDFLNEFKKIKDPLNAIKSFISLQEKVILMPDNQDMIENIPEKYHHLKDIMSNITYQIIETRFHFARDFTLYCHLLNTNSSLVISFLSRINQNLKMSYVQYWLSKKYTKNDQKFLSLFHDYLNSENVYSNEITKLSSDNDLPYLLSISHLLLFSSLNTIQSLWLIGDKSKCIEIAQMLYDKEEYEILEEFSRLLLFENPYLNYYMGLSSLKKFQLNKAKDYFYKLSYNLTAIDIQKQTLVIFGIDLDKCESQEDLIFFYFNNLRKICEKYPTLNLEFSKSALKETFDPEQRSILLKNIFTIYLGQEEFDQAYECIVQNSNRKNRKLDLNLFLSTLYEKGIIYKINTYSFRDMITQVVEFLHLKAKSNRVTTSPHLFEVLYSFLFIRGQFTKSAFYMYEFAQKIDLESNDSKLLYKKRECYLSCLNSLEMNPKEQWFIFQSEKGGKLIRMKDVQKEYWINEGRIILSKKSMIETNDPNEIISLLVNNNYYDLAFHISDIFDIDKSLIFERLTKSCLEEQISGKPFVIHLEDSFLFNKKEKDLGWKMIEYYLKKYEQNYYKKVVIETVFTVNSHLNIPLWLKESFIKTDASTLLRIYIKFDKLQNAKEIEKRMGKNEVISDFYLNILRKDSNFED